VRKDGPTGLVLTRQKVAKVKRAEGFDPASIARGGYVVEEDRAARVTVAATGSEVATAQAALALLRARGIAARLVSIPCLACFEEQPEEYRREVIPPSQRVAVVEAATGVEWWRLAGRDGLVVGVDRFGASAPEGALAQEYGFTPARVADRIERWAASAR
jgi:transketolase